MEGIMNNEVAQIDYRGLVRPTMNHVIEFYITINNTKEAVVKGYSYTSKENVDSFPTRILSTIISDFGIKDYKNNEAIDFINNFLSGSIHIIPMMSPCSNIEFSWDDIRPTFKTVDYKNFATRFYDRINKGDFCFTIKIDSNKISVSVDNQNHWTQILSGR